MKFSTVICNYNYGRFLGSAVESCLAQRYPHGDLEVIVVDDGSTDESSEVLSRYEANPRVRVIRQPNRGQGAALNAGVEAASGDYVCLLDADDMFHPDKLSRLRTHIESLAPLDNLFLCHDVRLYDDSTSVPTEQTWFEVINLASTPAQLSLEQCDHQFPFAIPCGQVLNRSLAKRVLGAIPGSDWRYAADSPIGHTAFLETGLVHYLHECLAFYRIHGGNDLARLVNGRYQPRPNWKNRVPSLTAHLERYLNTLHWDDTERGIRTRYLKSKEARLRVTSPVRRLRAPAIGLLVDARCGNDALEATLTSIAAQEHAPTTVAVLASRGAAQPHPTNRSTTRFVWVRDDDLAQALSAMDGSFIACLDAGVELAPDFLARLLNMHQYASLTRMAFCNGAVADTRLPSIYEQLGIRAEHLRPFDVPLDALALPTVNAALMRRGPLLDRLLAQAWGQPNWRAAATLLLHSLAGSVFAPEPLLSVGAPRAALLAPMQATGPDTAPAIWSLYCGSIDLLARHTTPAWELAFGRWLAPGLDRAALERMRTTAQGFGATAALEILDELGSGSALR